MSNIKEWIEQLADGEEVEAVVLGEMGWGDYGSDAIEGYDNHKRGTVLSWEDAIPFIQYEFDTGYGAPGNEAFYAWTKSWVICSVQYDGSTWAYRVPRNPIDVMPYMVGG